MPSTISFYDKLKSKGVSVLPNIGESNLKALLDTYKEKVTPRLEKGSMYWSMSDNDKVFAANLSNQVMPILVEHISQFIPDLMPIISAFMVKPAHSPSVNFHQDWTFVDKEPEFSSYTCWIPLVDVNEENGIMGFIPHSQEEYTFYRASPSPPFGHNFPETEEYFAKAEYMSLKAGEPVVFNHRTVHGSKPNFSDDNRPAVALSFRTKGSTLIHVSVQPNSNEQVLDKYLIDESFFDLFSNDIILDYYQQGKPLPNLKKIEDVAVK